MYGDNVACRAVPCIYPIRHFQGFLDMPATALQLNDRKGRRDAAVILAETACGNPTDGSCPKRRVFEETHIISIYCIYTLCNSRLRGYSLHFSRWAIPCPSISYSRPSNTYLSAPSPQADTASYRPVRGNHLPAYATPVHTCNRRLAWQPPDAWSLERRPSDNSRTSLDVSLISWAKVIRASFRFVCRKFFFLNVPILVTWLLRGLN